MLRWKLEMNVPTGYFYIAFNTPWFLPPSTSQSYSKKSFIGLDWNERAMRVEPLSTVPSGEVGMRGILLKLSTRETFLLELIEMQQRSIGLLNFLIGFCHPNKPRQADPPAESVSSKARTATYPV